MCLSAPTANSLPDDRIGFCSSVSARSALSTIKLMLAVFATEDDGSDRDDIENN